MLRNAALTVMHYLTALTLELCGGSGLSLAPSPTLAHSRPSRLLVVLWLQGVNKDLQMPSARQGRSYGRRRGKRELAHTGAAILIHLWGVSKN